MDTELRDFSIMIPRVRMIEMPHYLINRIDAFIKSKSTLCVDMEEYKRSEVLYNFVLISGKAPVEVVTVLAAFAQGHDVATLLDTFET